MADPARGSRHQRVGRDTIGSVGMRGVLEDGRPGGTFETGEGKIGTWTATRCEPRT